MVADDLLEMLVKNMESILTLVVRLPSINDSLTAEQDYLALQAIDTDGPGVLTVAPFLSILDRPSDYRCGDASVDEQTLEIGAQGTRQMHVLFIEGQPE